MPRYLSGVEASSAKAPPASAGVTVGEIGG
jgi:hypothetical protein